MRCFRDVIRLLIALLVVGSVVACSSEDCPINNTVLGKMVFRNVYGDLVSINGALTVSAVRQQGDTIVINRKANASEVLFPMSYTHETDTLVFSYIFDESYVSYDSIYVTHVNTPVLVSVDCGTAMFHTIISVASTHHLIDTLLLNSPDVDYDERENIQVIYRTAD